MQETDGSDPEATNHSNGHEDVDLSATTSENEGLARGGEVGYYYVRPYTWTPDFGKQEVVLDACRGAEAGGYLPCGAECTVHPRSTLKARISPNKECTNTNHNTYRGCRQIQTERVDLEALRHRIQTARKLREEQACLILDFESLERSRKENICRLPLAALTREACAVCRLTPFLLWRYQAFQIKSAGPTCDTIRKTRCRMFQAMQR